jgi:hypothetical protein
MSLIWMLQGIGLLGVRGSQRMLAVSKRKDRSKACGNGLYAAAGDFCHNDIRPGRTAVPLGRIIWARRVRRGKVLAVRRKLAEGKYDLNRRLSVAVERIMDDLAARPRHVNR